MMIALAVSLGVVVAETNFLIEVIPRSSLVRYAWYKTEIDVEEEGTKTTIP